MTTTTTSKTTYTSYCVYGAVGVVFLLTCGAADADLGVIDITGPAAQSTGVPFEVGDTPEGEFTGFKEVIVKEELQQAGGSLAEVIASESGVQFRQSGGLGSFSSISLRGSTAEQVNVYLDGVLLNEAAGGGVNLSHIELMQAERVEVYRGTVPVQLGNSAIGGAVNITTARATDNTSTSLLAGFGSFGSSRFSSAFTGPLNWLNGQRLVASFSHRQSENNFSFLNDNGTPINTEDDETEPRRNAQTSSTSAFLKTDHQLVSGGRLEHAFQLSRHHQGISDWRNTPRGSATLDTDNLQWRSTFSNSASEDGWSSSLGGFFSTKSELYDDSDSTIGTGRQKINSDTQAFGGRAYFEKLLRNQSLTFNLRARSETLESSNELVASNRTNAHRLRSDLNVQWNRYFKDRSSLFSASIFGFALKDEYDIDNNENARADFDELVVMPQLGLHYTLGEALAGQWSLTANASRQKRAPSFFELFGNQGLFEGNSELRTETANNVDIGVEWRSDVKLGIDAVVQLALFQSRKNNLISRVYNARGVGRSENISKAQSSGFELISSFAFGNGFSIDANLTVQDAENLSNISGSTGMQIPGEAAQDGALKARWKNNRWKAEYEFNFNAERFYDSPNYLPAIDQRIHSARLSRYWRDWRVDLEVDNLTNRNYEDFNGYPKPGRAGFISIVYQPKAEGLH